VTHFLIKVQDFDKQNMRSKKMWRSPYCSSISPRHWNMERHIRSQHGFSGEPIDSITGLIRSKSFASRCSLGYERHHFLVITGVKTIAIKSSGKRPTWLESQEISS
jgi:hypothetical protein